MRQRAAAHHLEIAAEVRDLTAPDFQLAPESFHLIVIAFYLQRDLFAQAKAAVKPGGVVLAIAHIPDPGEPPSPKRASPGELLGYFTGHRSDNEDDWTILWDYEGPSRDPAHRRPVAELAARRPILAHRLSGPGQLG